MSNEAERMKKKRQRTSMPKLRFPEFRAAVPWEPHSLIELADKNVKWSFIGGPFGSNLKSSDYTPQGVRIIQLQNIGDGEFLNDYKIYTSKSKADELLSCNAYPGEIILSKMGDPVGRAAILPAYENRYVMCSDGIRLVVDNKQFVRDFVFLAINFESFRRRVEAAATGSTRKRIALDTLKRLQIEIPQPREQKKIADCLSSLDELVAAEGRKLEALKTHKKGLMQQLFPQTGQTQPRLRFPEFRNDGEWEEKSLGSVSDVLMCKRIFASETSPKGEVPFYKIGTLGGTPDAFISKNLYEEYKSKYNFPRIGEILITCSGTIGKCLPYDGSDAYFQDSNIVWIDNPTLEVSNDFLLRILFSSSWSTLNSTTITRIYGPDLRRLRIKFPQNEKEQQRITECLSALDTQIVGQAAKIESLKQHKRGLMQQLFPAPEEP